jgi:hypothetical protein
MKCSRKQVTLHNHISLKKPQYSGFIFSISKEIYVYKTDFHVLHCFSNRKETYVPETCLYIEEKRIQENNMERNQEEGSKISGSHGGKYEV